MFKTILYPATPDIVDNDVAPIVVAFVATHATARVMHLGRIGQFLAAWLLGADRRGVITSSPLPACRIQRFYNKGLTRLPVSAEVTRLLREALYAQGRSFRFDSLTSNFLVLKCRERSPALIPPTPEKEHIPSLP